MADEPTRPGQAGERRAYTEADLHIIDVEDWQRRYWTKWYGPFDAHRLCALIVEIAVECGALVTEVHVADGWWTVVGDHDWLESIPGGDSHLLDRGWPVPGIVNSMRPEFFFHAFAEHVVVSREREVTLLKGRPSGCPLLAESFASRWRRGVSFMPVGDGSPARVNP